MPNAAPAAEHPTYRALLAGGRAEARGTAADGEVRRHLATCAICRDVQRALAEAPVGDLAESWLDGRPVTLSAADIAGIVGLQVEGVSRSTPVAQSVLLEGGLGPHVASGPQPTPTGGPRVLGAERDARRDARRRGWPGSAWRWTVGPAGLAAAVVLAVLVRGRGDTDVVAPPAPVDVPGRVSAPVPGGPSVTADATSGGSPGGVGAAPDGAPRRAPLGRAGAGVPRTDGYPRGAASGTRGAPTPERATVPRLGPARPPATPVPTPVASASIGETALGLRVVLTGAPNALDAVQTAALDSVAARLARGPDRRILVRYADPSLDGASPSARLAQRAQDRLLLRGADPARVRLDRVQTLGAADPPVGAGVIEVVVRRLP